MRTVQTKITTVKGDRKYVTTKTITYMKVGDLIGTAKTAYDLGKVLRRKKSTILSTLKQYGVSYINNLLTPLIALVTGMDIYKSLMLAIQIATPIAKTIARGSGIWASWGNAGDIASILLSTVSQILVQIATIFLLKMKDMIWNFEFKIKEVSNQIVVSAISNATSNTVSKCSELVNKKVKNTPTEKECCKNVKGTLAGVNVFDGFVSVNGDMEVKYSDTNNGIKYRFGQGDWQESMIIENGAERPLTDGSFKPSSKDWNGIIFAISYEGENLDSKQYGIIYSIDKGKIWRYLKESDKDYYGYDLALFNNAINFSTYTDVLKYDGIWQSRRKYVAIPPLTNVEYDKIYVDYEYYYDVNGELIDAPRHTTEQSETTNDVMLKQSRIITYDLEIGSDGLLLEKDFQDELTTDGIKVEDIMVGNLKRYGDVSCIDFQDVYFGAELEETIEVSEARCSIPHDVYFDTELEQTVDVNKANCFTLKNVQPNAELEQTTDVSEISCVEFYSVRLDTELEEKIEVNATCSIIKNIHFDTELEETVEVNANCSIIKDIHFDTELEQDIDISKLIIELKQ